jgi:hypothetical protein
MYKYIIGDLKCMSVNTCYLLVIVTFVLQMSALAAVR